MSGGQMYPTQFDVGQVFKISFELWKQNLGILIGMTAVYFGISIGHSIVNNVLNAVMMNTNDQTTKLVILAITIVLTFIIWAVNIWITIGQIRISLNLLRGLPANFGQLFSGADVFLPVFGVSLLFGLGLTLGLLFLIIPGIIFALFYWPVYYFVLDKKLRVFESFNDSPQYTKINIANSFIIFLMGAGINLLGVLACCIGVIASMPLVIMLTSASYLAMTGQLNYNPNNQQNYVG